MSLPQRTWSFWNLVGPLGSLFLNDPTRHSNHSAALTHHSCTFDLLPSSLLPPTLPPQTLSQHAPRVPQSTRVPPGGLTEAPHCGAEEGGTWYELAPKKSSSQTRSLDPSYTPDGCLHRVTPAPLKICLWCHFGISIYRFLVPLLKLPVHSLAPACREVSTWLAHSKYLTRARSHRGTSPLGYVLQGLPLHLERTSSRSLALQTKPLSRRSCPTAHLLLHPSGHGGAFSTTAAPPPRASCPLRASEQNLAQQVSLLHAFPPEETKA